MLSDMDLLIWTVAIEAAFEEAGLPRPKEVSLHQNQYKFRHQVRVDGLGFWRTLYDDGAGYDNRWLACLPGKWGQCLYTGTDLDQAARAFAAFVKKHSQQPA